MAGKMPCLTVRTDTMNIPPRTRFQLPTQLLRKFFRKTTIIAPITGPYSVPMPPRSAMMTTSPDVSMESVSRGTKLAWTA